jgi:hypothetical protein
MRKIPVVFAMALPLLTGCSANEYLASYFKTPPPVVERQQLSLDAGLQQALRLEQEGNWGQARKTYKEALADYPHSKQLHSRYNAFKGRYVARAARVEVERLVQQAEWLKTQHKARQAYDRSYRGEHWAKLVLISKQLARKGERAMRHNQMDLAGLALRQSVKMHSNPTTRAALDQYQSYKERMELARLVKRGRQMADISYEPVRR